MTSPRLLALQQILDQVRGVAIASIDTRTEARLLGGQANPMVGRVQKCMIGGSVLVYAMKDGSGYENMVRRRLEQEGKDPSSFVLHPRKWGHRIMGTPFVEHKGDHYLEVIIMRPGKTHYEYNGQPIAPEMIQGLPVGREESEQGGLTNKVFFRDFKIESVEAVSFNGSKHIL